MGLIVSEVIEVIELSAEAIRPPPEFDVEARRRDYLAASVARVGDGIVTLPDASQLMRQQRPHAGLPQNAGNLLSGKLDVELT